MSICHERIRELRKERNISVSEMTELLGMGRRNYQRYETGDIDIPSSKLVALCDFFNVSADYLLGRNERAK